MSLTEEVPTGLAGVDAFTVLGLAYSPDLTDEEVRSPYLLRLRAVHPDSGGDADAAAVTAAYDALRSGVRRGELLAAVTVNREDVPSRRARRRDRAGRAPRDSGTGEREGERGPGGRPDPARLAELRRKVAASRAEQGLPPYITDEATLDKIVDLLVVMQQREASTRPHPRQAEPPALERDSQRPVAERGRAGAGRPVPVAGSRLASGWARVRYGRPWWLAGRVVLAAVVVLVAEVAAAGDPAVWALGTGAVTWLARTGRFDLAPRPRR